MVTYDGDDGLMLIQLRAYRVTGKRTHQGTLAVQVVKALLRGETVEARRLAQLFEGAEDTFEEILPNSIEVQEPTKLPPAGES